MAEIKIIPDISKAFEFLSPENVGHAATIGIKAALKEAEAELEQGFSNESSPGGGKWKELNPDYARWKEAHYGAQPILQREGTLMKAAFESMQEGRVSLDSPGVASVLADYQGPPYSEYVNAIRPFFEWTGQAEQSIEDAGLKAFGAEIEKGSS